MHKLQEMDRLGKEVDELKLQVTLLNKKVQTLEKCVGITENTEKKVSLVKEETKEEIVGDPFVTIDVLNLRPNSMEEMINESAKNELPNRDRDFENRIGKYAIGILASVLVFIGVSLLASALLVSIPTWIKALLPFIISFAFLGVGFRLIKQSRNTLSLSVTGCGVGSVYISILVAYFGFHVINDIIMILLLVLWSILALLTAYKLEADLFKLISYIGFNIATFLAVMSEYTSLMPLYVASYMIFVLIVSMKKMHTKDTVYNIIYSSSSAMLLFIQFKSLFTLNVKALTTSILLLLLFSVYNTLRMVMNSRRATNKDDGTVLLVSGFLVASFSNMIAMVYFLLEFTQELRLEFYVTGTLIHEVAVISAYMVATYLIFEKSASRESSLNALQLSGVITMIILFILSLIGEMLIPISFGMYILLRTKFKKHKFNEFFVFIISELALLTLCAKPFILFGVLNAEDIDINYRIVISILVGIAIPIIWYIKAVKNEYEKTYEGYMRTFSELVILTYVLGSLYYITTHCFEIIFGSSKASVFTIMLILVLFCSWFMLSGYGSKDLNSKICRLLKSDEERSQSWYLTYIVHLAAIVYGLINVTKFKTESPVFALILLLLTLVLCTEDISNIFKYSYFIEIKDTTFLLYVLQLYFGDVKYIASICCLILAVASIIAGFKFNFKPFRLYGLIVTLVSVAKLILFDITYADTIAKSLSYIVAGIICFIIVLIYNIMNKQLENKN